MDTHEVTVLMWKDTIVHARMRIRMTTTAIQARVQVMDTDTIISTQTRAILGVPIGTPQATQTKIGNTKILGQILAADARRDIVIAIALATKIIALATQ